MTKSGTGSPPRRLQLGYALSSEEHGPSKLVSLAAQAEAAGFEFALIFDHFHPWTSKQGESPFVWAVLGGIAQSTERLRVGTGVTCPTVRTHPAIIAQAAASVAAMMPGRFFLGVGSGENLNEHIVGAGWPNSRVRMEMLREAVEVIRLLWQGGVRSHSGRHYRVDSAQLFTLPDELPPIAVAAGAPAGATLAGEIGDAFISTKPERGLVERFQASGERGDRPRYGQLTVCYAKDEERARRIAHEWWPTAAIPGELTQELPQPRHFEQASETVTPELVAEAIVCGPDPDRHLEGIRKFVDAGFDHVYVHQVGPEQEEFFRFYEDEVLPRVADAVPASSRG